MASGEPRVAGVLSRLPPVPTPLWLRPSFPGHWPFSSGALMRDLIKLTCETCTRANYYTSKNKRTMPEKFTIKKFCNACRAHKVHKEGKISKG